MTEVWKKLYQGEVGTASGTLYTVPAATEAIIKHIRLVSTSTSDETITLWHGAAGDATIILPAVTILAGAWAEFEGVITMAAADVIAGDASTANEITATIYGLEIS